MEPARRRQQRRNPPLVLPQQRDHDSLHLLTNFRTSLRSSSNGASRAVRRGLITTSQRATTAAISARQASRIRRRIRLRWTDFPTALGTVNPTLGPVARPGSAISRQKAVNRRVLNRVPWSYTRLKSPDLRMRLDLGNPRVVTDGESAGGLLDGLGFADGSLIADRQFPAALGAAPRQYGLTILGFHARPEAMRLGTFAVIRLERSLRHCISSGCPGRRASPWR